MQKIVVTYLASLILLQGIFTNTDILFEASELIEDYQLHKTNYGDDMYTFLSKHFGDLKESHKEQHQKDHKQHKHPIQNNTGSLLQVDFTLLAFLFTDKSIIEKDASASNFNYIDLHSTFEKQKVFQPPRIA